MLHIGMTMLEDIEKAVSTLLPAIGAGGRLGPLKQKIV